MSPESSFRQRRRASAKGLTERASPLNLHNPKPKPSSKALSNELMHLPQSLLLCCPGTYRPQYSLAFGSGDVVLFGSATTRPISGACAVDTSKTTRGKVVLYGATENGNVLKIRIRRHPTQKKNYLATVSIGKTKLEDRIIYGPED